MNAVFIASLILFLLDLLTCFDIKNQNIKSFVYLFPTYGSILLIGLNLQQKLNKTMLIFPIIGLVALFILNSRNLLNLKSAWKTQTIIYENGHFSNKKIEFQMQDIGARGYIKREVEVFYLTPLFMITADVPKNIEKKVEWIKVNKEVNKQNLKY